jgi:5-formyltetrahydrofolate cyclo-ligase
VQTLKHIEIALSAGKRVFIPFCDKDDLKLFHLVNLGELAPGEFGIPEPRFELRRDPKRVGTIDEIELAVLPGVAFGRDGSRLGNGRGYYDRLLSARNDRTFCVGLAFECQMSESLPIENHDVQMDAVLTEVGIYGPRKERLETADGFSGRIRKGSQ